MPLLHSFSINSQYKAHFLQNIWSNMGIVIAYLEHFLRFWISYVNAHLFVIHRKYLFFNRFFQESENSWVIQSVMLFISLILGFLSQVISFAIQYRQNLDGLRRIT
ncbi:hypothetical protein FGO68_gene125 [Halteria grandinella]|uniref:Uncharacterized protein n=1 Tax=Halteria grandinella TaxID=5974 RepID=A0A8J8NL49_HALGN|nr:hypothetical protein FGO68_gene125 [Halteria grandinella]